MKSMRGLYEKSSPGNVYYKTTSMCPICNSFLPGEVVGRDNGIFVTRTCEKHGIIDGLVCSDVAWFESLYKFDVLPNKPKSHSNSIGRGCPHDCGLCSEHRQSAGTAAIEISNACNLRCPVCLGDNKDTFAMSAAKVKKIADDLIANQGSVDALTLSGGEPSLHPKIFEIIEVLERPEITRIVMNSNGVRIAEDDWFLNELKKHPKVSVCLHYDGPNAQEIRGVRFAMQEKALDRLLKWNINVVPIMLGVKDVTEPYLGSTIAKLLTRSTAVKSVFLSLMAYSGPRGSTFPGNPANRLTIPCALERLESTSRGLLRKCDFMPLPMPNPLCAAIGYFIVMDGEITPIIPMVEIDRVIDFVKNSHFAKAGDDMEAILKYIINDLYANPDKHLENAKLLSIFKRLLKELFPDGRNISVEERRQIAEERIKTVYLMQFMDAWTFDSVRLSKCSCQHLFPDGKIVPSCGYYTYHRSKDPRFAI
ncbi:MAG: radical SAM protein [Candidatus Riflebacteria bacterium]|nr:radical SAM protein [Candidatus Riflebacteria bacterium]